MDTTGTQGAGLFSAYAQEMSTWLLRRDVRAERCKRVVATLARLSEWLAGSGCGSTDLSEDLLDAYIAAEQSRSGSRTPAAFQYVPLIKRFLAARHGMVLQSRRSRDLGGIPRLRKGPLAPRIPDLVDWLTTHGYAPGTRASVACTMARLSAWMDTHHVGLDQLDEALLSRFAAAQSHGRHRHLSSVHRSVTVRTVLAGNCLLPAPASDAEPPVMTTPAQDLLDGWSQDLQERGLSPSTISEYRRWVAALITALTAPDGIIQWQRLTGPMINRYVAERGTGFSLASRRHLVTAVRSLLMWAWRTGVLHRPMAAAVLTPRRPRAGLPKALTPGQVARLVDAADTGTPAGLRDRAIIVLLRRLGVRAGEAAGLTLDDLDWHHGELTVHGKGDRTLVPPIPADVGAALIDYLTHGRRYDVPDRAVFLRKRPPLIGLTSKGISSVVRHQAARAGLGVVHAHRLRHTAATAV